MKNKKEKRGFTLIELLAVLIILAILAAFTTLAVINYIDNSRKSTLVIIAKNITEAVIKEELDKNSINNTNITYDLLNSDKSLLENELKRDPWGSKYKEAKVTKTNNTYLICIYDETGHGLKQYYYDLDKNIKQINFNINNCN